MDDKGIDYAALAYSSGLTALMEHDFGVGTVAHLNIARAVVAALRDQELVVVRRGLLELARSSLASHETYHGGLIFQPELDEIDALVAAPSAEEDA